MKAVNVGGRKARRFGVRVLFAALACALALAGGAGRFGASAQKTAGGSSKQGVAPGKGVPGRAAASGAGQGKSKEGKAKAGDAVTTAAAPGDVVSPLSVPCGTPQAITSPQTVNGVLQTGDCTLNEAAPFNDGSLYDAYSFSGTAGQQVVITMSSTQFDTYLILLKPGETTVTQGSTITDDDSGGGTDSRIPGPTGRLTLPATGTYTILANAFRSPADGGQGSYTLTFTSFAACSPTTTAITPVVGGTATATGSLSSTDCTLDDGSSYDVYTFSGTAGQQVSVQMHASFDTFLFLVGPDGDELARDDNGSGTSDARIPAVVSGFGSSPVARLPQTGTYQIIANSVASGASGSYTISLTVGSASCPSAQISPGQTVSGSLAGTDCRLPADGSFIDVYTFNGTAGQNVGVTMTSTDFDAYLFILDKDGKVLDEDDNGGGGTNAHLPSGQNAFTGVLPATGTYTIYANSSLAGKTGNYTLSVTGAAACTYALPSVSRVVASAGGTFADSYTTQPGCAAPSVTTGSAFVTVGAVTAPNASGAGTFGYTVAANATASARAGAITVGGQSFTVNQSASGAAVCATTIYPNAVPFTQAAGSGRFTVFPASSSCNAWAASTSASWIHITAPAGGNGSGTARVRFTVDANTGTTTRTGSITVGTSTLTVSQTSSSSTPQVQFTTAGYSANENDASKAVQITVQRVGDATGAASVDYRTVDDQAAVPCDPNSTSLRGTAYARCDYVTNIDTLTFSAGETTKTFSVSLIDDAHVEGNETFHVALSNPQGATLGAPTDAVVTIVDNDQPGQANPIFTTDFFVRQQYLDFLSREPDAAGMSAWASTINNCPSGDQTCDRVSVSANFFRSTEFQIKGFFVFLYYKVSFGSSSNPNYYPAYDEIIPDMRRVTGNSTEERIDKTFNFAEDWVTRTAFVQRYGSMTNAQFVDTLLSNVGATLSSADPVSGETRDSLVAKLNSGAMTRAEVLRVIVESSEVNRLQFNPAFVAMQYYGYLRRTPEAGGYQAWLDTINPPRSANPHDMVNGFVNSVEYNLRFGPNTH
jgi:hypothetical protein